MERIDGVKLYPLNPAERLPLVVEPEVEGLDPVAWAAAHRARLDAELDAHGAVLFRNFEVPDQQKFLELAGAVADLLDYVYRSTPRTTVGSKVYTSTEYTATASIPMHCENAFQRDWPMKLLFFCAQPAEEGGRTPLAEISGVTERIAPEIRERFRRKQVMYVRNYGLGVDLPWQTVFQTEERGQVEAYCRDHDIDFEWLDGGRLRTRQVCQGMATHPRSGELLFFNQAHLFHYSSLDEQTRQALLAFYKEDELPRNAYYGDGSPLEPETLEAIRAAFEGETVSFPWQRGDVLMVDNMAVAHGRTPYSGDRKILVAMGNARSSMAAEAA